MTPRAIDAKVLEALAAGASSMAELRQSVGLKAAEAKDSVQRLRWKGRVEFNRLALTPTQILIAKTGKDSAAAPGPSEAAEISDDPASENSAVEAGPPASAATFDEGGATSSAPPSSPTPSAAEESGVSAPFAAPGEAEALSSADAGGGGAFPTPPPSSADADVLLGEIGVYCARNQVEETDLGRWALRHSGFVGLLRKRRTLSGESAAIVRAFMEQNPEGIPPGPAPSFDAPRSRPSRAPIAAAPQLPPPAPSPPAPAPSPAPPTVAEQVREEAAAQGARRRPARNTGTVKTPLSVKPETTAELIQTIGIGGPLDLMRAVSLRHPELWKRAILLGRATRQRPLVALYAALEVGLDQLQSGGNG